MEATTEEAVNAVTNLAAGAAEHGKDNMFTGFVLFFMITLVLVGLYVLRIMTSKKYIKTDKVLDYMEKNHKDLLKQDIDAEELMLHAVFEQWKKVSSACNIINMEHNGKYDKSRTDFCKDYIRTRMRNIRGGLEAILKKSFEHKDGFDEYFGSEQKFEARILSIYTRVENLLRHQMISEFSVPERIYNDLKNHMILHDELMREMVQQAAKRSRNYDRIYDTLTSQFAAAVNIVDGVTGAISKIDMGDFEYKPRTDTTFAEMQKVTNDSMHLFKNVFDPED